MRRKSLNPKRLSNGLETVIDDQVKPQPGHPNSGTCQHTTKRVKSELKSDDANICLNGSEQQTNAAALPTHDELPGKKSPLVFTFESTNTKSKCSCHVPKKDQSCQTTSNPSEWFSVAVNASQTDLPSPSWSHSSDSESSLPRTPHKKQQYKCYVCQKPFPTPSKLRRHFLTHSGEKPYPCSICYKPFNDPANLKRHYWTHVKDKPFICQDCQGKFMTKREAMMHICPSLKRKRKLDMDVEEIAQKST